MKNFEMVLEILTAASPNPVTKEQLAEQLDGKIEAYRLATYIWEIKTKAEIPVTSVKEGRRVVAFAIPTAIPTTAPTDQGIVEAFVADVVEEAEGEEGIEAV